MPFTYRDRPKLSERLRGKSGEELLNEMKNEWDDRRTFFDSPSWANRQTPNASSFPRGFPFDEERGRTNIRSYLDEFANRHPEFADQLRGPPWSEEFVNSSFGRKRRGSGSGGEESPRSQPGGSGSQQQGESAKQQTTEPEEARSGGLKQFGLRNTVPLVPPAQTLLNEEDRRQRSMSAPPDNRTGDKPKRFQSKCEITLQDPEPNQGKPPVPPKGAEQQQQQPQQQQQQHPQQQQPPNSARNVRVIPIQVEGRDAPVVNSNIDTSASFGGETQFRESPFDARMPRDFGCYQKHSPRFSNERVPPQQFYQSPPAGGQPQASTQPPTAAADEPDAAPPVQKQEPKDPISKVEVIQKDVDDLLKHVECFAGNSRCDKQYIYLDEMLTRNLIKLDDIDTEGKENVRQARKDAIRSIQRCISILENRVPMPKSEEAAQENVEQPMEIDKTKENTPVPVPSEEQHKMDVENTSGAGTSV